MEKKSLKSKIIKWVLFAIGLIGAVVAIVFDAQIFGESSIFNKLISSNAVVNMLYQKVPSLIRSLQIAVISIAVYLVVSSLLLLTLRTSNRGITIARLCASFLKWALAIGALMFILNAWGIDATTLLASAGILTLIVGLGAQSLVADIVAGVFIVFEGEFQVGDIVVINNWRGTVKEIGIRTTKVVDSGGNVNIINNSEITTLINQTQEISVAKCVVGIEYSESLTRVELIIKNNLEKIKENIPLIIEGPFYKGVDLLNASSVDLLFVAKCKEEDVFQVQRDLNRELKLLFDENNVNIPFPQVVVNQAKQATEAPTAKEKKQAKDFVNEQKELSVGIELQEDDK
ncbi:MAG: mechanosensitive ion channel family protein [Clostridia bacterium]|nr:mechanosensitive ion channel family protein [Clostridia bacterium]